MCLSSIPFKTVVEIPQLFEERANSYPLILSRCFEIVTVQIIPNGIVVYSVE